MKNKTSLILIEQLMMLLVFVLASAICLKIFVYSSNVSSRNEAVSQAAVLAQNCAEELKRSHGEDDDKLQTEIGEWKYRGIVLKRDSGMKNLGCATIVVYGEYRNIEEKLFELSVAWQEVDVHE